MMKISAIYQTDTELTVLTEALKKIGLEPKGTPKSKDFFKKAAFVGNLRRYGNNKMPSTKGDRMPETLKRNKEKYGKKD